MFVFQKQNIFFIKNKQQEPYTSSKQHEKQNKELKELFSNFLKMGIAVVRRVGPFNILEPNARKIWHQKLHPALGAQFVVRAEHLLLQGTWGSLPLSACLLQGCSPPPEMPITVLQYNSGNVNLKL